MFFTISFQKRILYRFRASDWADARTVLAAWAKRNNYSAASLDLDEA